MELKYYLRGLGLGIIVTAIIMGVAAPGRQTMSDAEIISRAKQLGMIEGRVLSDTAEDDGDASDDEDESEEDDASDKQNAPADGDASEKENTPDDKTASLGAETGKTEAAVQGNSAQARPQEAGGEQKAVTTPAASETVSNKTTAAAPEPEAGSVNRKQDAVQADTQAETEPQDDGENKKPVSNAPMVITIGSGDGSYAVSKKLADIGAISSPENFDTFLCENGYDKKIRTGTYTIPADASNEQMARIITGAE